MSECPGLSLEDYVGWLYSIIVAWEEDKTEDQIDMFNTMVLNSPRLKLLTPKQFHLVMELFEPYRKAIEDNLKAFDPEETSWISYLDTVFDDLPPDIIDDITSNVVNAFSEENRTKRSFVITGNLLKSYVKPT